LLVHGLIRRLTSLIRGYTVSSTAYVDVMDGVSLSLSYYYYIPLLETKTSVCYLGFHCGSLLLFPYALWQICVPTFWNNLLGSSSGWLHLDCVDAVVVGKTNVSVV